MYEARKIANFLLQEFDSRDHALTNMKINKLLYFIQGWGYARLNRKIIRNHFVAWEYGPVVRSVFDAFKHFGSEPITEPAKFLNYETGYLEFIACDTIDEESLRLIRKVIPYYIVKSTSELVRLTHCPGGPWDAVRTASSNRQTMFDRIPDEFISRYFKREFGGVSEN